MSSVLAARGLTKRYGSFTAVHPLDLAVEHPSVFGLCAAIAPPQQTASVVSNQPKARAAVILPR